MTLADPNLGRVVGGRYRLVAELGRGGMGTVYRAVHLELEKDFAVKVLRPEVARTEEASRRFDREAEAMSRLRHPGCVAVTDFGKADDGSPFLVMEFLEGPSLARTLTEEGRLAPARAVEIAAPLLEAVAAAHDLGIVHRDLKPENVILSPFGVKILDFGIAKILEAGESGITDAQAVFGTPEYLSPEQALGESADTRADLYAIGVMLYEMLAGRRPFEGAKMEVIGQHLTKEPPPVPVASLEPIVKKALAKRREDRWQSAAEFREALLSAELPDAAAELTPAPDLAHEETRPLEPEGGTAKAPKRQDDLVPEPKHSPSGLGAFASWRFPVLLLALAVVVYLVWPSPSEPAARAPAVAVARLAILSGRDLANGRVEAERLARAHPRDAAVLLHLGHLLFAGKEAEPARAMAAYREAIRLDAGLVQGDARVVEHLAATFGDELHGEDAFRLAENVGPPAGDAIVAYAGKARGARPLRRAIRAAEKVGAGSRLDRVALFGMLLAEGATCEERREATLNLKATGDARAIAHLEKALARRDGFRDMEEPNACIASELRDALDALRAKPK